jgi:hypothetical protein
MKKITVLIFAAGFLTLTATAQIDLSKIIKLDDIIGKVLNVKKGYAPKFSLGSIAIPKIMKVAEIIGVKKNAQAIKLFNTFKTGRVVYRIAEYAGLAISTYSAIKAIDKNALKEQYQKPLTAALTTMASGLVVKLLTKGAAYKAADVFNGIAKKKLKDILSVAPASSTMGMGLYVKL